MDVEKVELTVDGEPVKLTAKEFKILEFLMRNAGCVFSAEQIYERVWQERHILLKIRLWSISGEFVKRSKLILRNRNYLKVVWGIGYKIEKI